MSTIEIAVLINSLVIIGLIIAVMVLRSNFKRLDQKSFELWRRETSSIHNAIFEVDVLADQKLLARVLNAKAAYCMDFNKENGLYCTHFKNHKYWNMFMTGMGKHKTHQNGEVKWAMVKKAKA